MPTPVERSTNDGSRWWTTVRILLALACVTWVLAMLQKGPCALDGFDGSDSRYAQLCYSDIPFLYVPRGMAERAVPYTDSAGRYPDLEYPVLIGYVAYGSALVTQAVHGWPDLQQRTRLPADEVYRAPGVEGERRDYFWVNAVLLAPFALLSAWLLAGVHPGRPRDALGFAVAPALVLNGMVNWDLIAVAAVAGALWAWPRGRPALTGACLGLGTAAKLYPALLLGAVLVICLRERRHRDLGVVCAAGAASWAVVNAPAMLSSFESWLGFWRFNADRGADLGSLWLVVSEHGANVSASTINVTSQLVLAGVCLGIAVLGLRAPVSPRLAQLGLLIVMAFLILNKVYSPQYVLWLLPLAVLARPRGRDLMIWQAGEVFYFVMVWMHLGGFTDPATQSPDLAYELAIVVRVAAQLYLAVVVVRDMLHPQDDPVRAGRGPDGRPEAWQPRSRALRCDDAGARPTQ